MQSDRIQSWVNWYTHLRRRAPGRRCNSRKSLRKSSKMQILLKATKKSWKAKKKNSQNRSKAWRKRVASGDHKELAKGQQGKCGGELRVNCSAVSHGMARENCCRVKWRQGGQRKRRKVCNVFKANFRPTKPYLSHVTAQAKVTVTVTVRVTVTVTVTLHVTLQLSFDFSVTAPHPTPLFCLFSRSLPLKVFEPILVSEIACEHWPIGFG